MVQTNLNSRATKRRLKHEVKTNEINKQAKSNFPQEVRRTGLLVTEEFAKAVKDCQERVAEIAEDCRRRNRKFRDNEFDLDRDVYRCLYGAGKPGPEIYRATDVQRVTQLFDKPAFFVDGADSNDIQQGQLGDCWFLSALATLTSAEGLIEKFCVARDQQVGVYGFIFFRDSTWVHVIIDDLLFTYIPKFEELSLTERSLYHNDKENYNKSARKTGKSLLFARSGTHGETWVPLVEKAFAKLHGNYAALCGGWHGEGIEDLTGGVSTYISVKDILDKDKFWTEELLRANSDRLFGCSFGQLDSSRSGIVNARVNGLIGGHAYSVLRAVEAKGKRFVVVRNPWGNSEWTGRWSDGSKEWSKEWLHILEKIGHEFGDDGQFVMEYDDFLENWEDIERIKLFNESWVMSSQWLDVTVRPFPSAWSYGDVSFTIEVPATTEAIIVLAQLDNRYYKPLDKHVLWTFDFIVYRKGEIKPICYSAPSRTITRSVNAEVELKAGTYVVHVRTDRYLVNPEPSVPPPPGPIKIDDKNSIHSDSDDEDGIMDQPRALARVLTEKAKSHSLSMNANKEKEAQYIPIPLSVLAGQDLSEIEEKAKVAAKALQKEMKGLRTPDDEPKPKLEDEDEKAEPADKEKEEDGKKEDDTLREKVDDEKKEDDEVREKVDDEKKEDDEIREKVDDSTQTNEKANEGMQTDKKEEEKEKKKHKKKKSKKASKKSSDSDSSSSSSGDSDSESEPDSEAEAKDMTSVMLEAAGIPGAGPDSESRDEEEDLINRITLGLRVYTSKDAPAKINGQLRHEMKLNFDGLAINTST